jgi:hypothetical protein
MIGPGDGVAVDGNALTVEFDRVGRTTALGHCVELAR